MLYCSFNKVIKNASWYNKWILGIKHIVNPAIYTFSEWTKHTTRLTSTIKTNNRNISIKSKILKASISRASLP